MRNLASFFKVCVISMFLLTTTYVFAGPPSWTRVDYTNTTAFVGWVRINYYDNTFTQLEEGDYIGAFVNGECRMIAEVFTYNSELYVSSVIHGGDVFEGKPSDIAGIDNTAEEIEWKVWDNSADAEISQVVKGTLMSDPGGEILDYEIGKPNAGSELESLTVSGVTLDQVFSATTLDYTSTLPNSTVLPVLSDYTALVADSRATVDITVATDFVSNNVTTITVTAEDNSTTVYTITYTEEGCLTPLPTTTTDFSYCVGETASVLTASASGTLKWYDDAASTTPLASAPQPETTVDGTTYYYVTNTDVCETEKVEIAVVVKPLPTAPIADSYTYCPTDVVSPITASGTALQWYDDLMNPIAAPGVPTTDVTYNVTSTVNSCESTPTEVTVVFFSVPNVDIVPDKNDVCNDEVINLNLSIPGEGTVTGSTGIVGETFDASLAQTAINNITYSYTSADGCVATDVEQITVTTKTAPVTTTPVSVELGANAPTLTATGDGTIQWYDDQMNALPAGDSYVTTVSTATDDTFTFFVTNTNGTCESAPVEVTVSVSGCSTTAPDVVSPVEYCQDEVSSVLTANAVGTLNWYATSTSMPALASAPTPETSVDGTFYYYVSQTDGCESARTPIEVIVKAKPDAPIVSDVTACLNTPFTELTATGQNLKWYDENLNPLTAPVTPTDAAIYNVTQTINGCESDPAQQEAIVAPLPVVSIVAISPDICVDGTTAFTTSPSGGTITHSAIVADEFVASAAYVGSNNVTYEYIDPISLCSNSATEVVTVSNKVAPVTETLVTVLVNESAPTLTATGDGVIQWYDDQMNALPAGDSYTTTIATDVAGTFTYFVTNTNSVCASDAVEVTVEVILCATPRPGVSTPTSYCVGETAAPLTATATGTLNWYASATSPTALPSAPTPETIVDGTTSYFVSQTDGCESARQEIVVEVLPLPTPPVTSNVEACAGDVMAELTAIGSLLQWYDKDMNPLSAPVIPASENATYYVSQSNGTCESAVSTVTITINDLPTVSITPDKTTACENEIVGLTVSPSTGGYIVSSAVSGTDFDASLALVGTNTIEFNYTDPVTLCSNSTSTSITVSDLPAAPVVSSPVMYCVGDVATALTANGTNLKWSDVNGPLTSAPVPPTSNAGSLLYFVTQSNSTCESLQSEIEVIINNNPTVSIIPSATDVCEDGAVSLTLTPATGGTLLVDGIEKSTFNVATETVGDHILEYSYTDNNSCSATDNTTVTIVPVTAPSTTPAISLLVNDLAPVLTATGDGTIKWYDENKTFIQSGTSYQTTISTAVANEFIFYVTNTNSTCESDFEQITITVTDCDVVKPTTTTAISYCAGDVASELVATGVGTINWYDSPTSTVPLTTIPTPSTINDGVTLYYVSQTNVCEGPKEIVTVTVNPIPAAPSVANQNVCEGTIISSLPVSGQNLVWYNSDAQIISEPTNISETSVYSVTQSIDGCTSLAADITVTVNAAPSKPTVLNPIQSVCEGTNATFVAIVEPTANVTWKDASNNIVSTTAQLVTNVAGEYTVIQSLGTCQSEPTTVTIYSKPIPAAPIVANVETCNGIQGQLSYSLPVNWYAAQTDNIPLATGLTYSPNVSTPDTYTYYVS